MGRNNLGMLNRPAGGGRGIGTVCCLMIAVVAIPSLTGGQVVGEAAEMERLQARAEEAIANGDAEGASMHMGKAALMAARLAKQAAALDRQRDYLAAEALFRAEEHGYRALALFQRAGGQPPASSGVCGSLGLAGQSLGHARELLDREPDGAAPVPPFRQGLRTAAARWAGTLDGLREDFQCP